jgi:hypothetical protein
MLCLYCTGNSSALYSFHCLGLKSRLLVDNGVLEPKQVVLGRDKVVDGKSAA